MEEDRIKKMLKEVLSDFKKDLDDSISKATIKRNDELIKSVRNDYREINIESLIKDYLSIGDLGDVSINYSFITDKRLKKQLTIDNLQMEKSRLGINSGFPDFLQFCKYAHFQIEGLISFYMYIKVGNSVERFKKKYPSVRLEASPFLTHSQKIFGFNLDFKIDIKKDYHGSARYNISNVRNYDSHRSVQSIKDDYVEKFPEGEPPKDLDKTKIEDNRVYYQYYRYKFICEEKYNEARNSIKDLVALIKKDLNL